MSYGRLKEMVRLELTERVRTPEEVTLSDGGTVRYASDEHVDDMRSTLAGLEALKKQHRYGSASRASFASAMFYLKRFLKRAEEAEQGGAPDEDDPGAAGIEDATDGRPPEVRRGPFKPSGLARGAEAPPYVPGIAKRKG